MGFESGPLLLMIGYVALWVRLLEFPRPTAAFVEGKGARRWDTAEHLQRLAEKRRTGAKGRSYPMIMGLGHLAVSPAPVGLSESLRLRGNAPSGIRIATDDRDM